MAHKKCQTWHDIPVGTRARAVCEALERVGTSLTCRELAVRTIGHPLHIVSTAAVISRLLQRGFLADAGPIDCVTTGRPVRTVRLDPNPRPITIERN